MHELSLCQAVADTVTKHTDGHSVRSIRLQVGYLRQVIPETLAFCWEMHTSGTDLEGSRLDIDHRPAVIVCSDCGESTELDLPIRVCGRCDSTRVELISGEEFLIESIDLGPVAKEAS